MDTTVCDNDWEECDDSIFGQLCDIDEAEKVNSNIDVQTNDVFNSNILVPTDVENPTKRKYCATESSRPHQELIKEQKKNMAKKLKNNSLFK